MRSDENELSLFPEIIDTPVTRGESIFSNTPAIRGGKFALPGGIKPDEEQTAILDHVASGGKRVMVNASAGAGKSSLLQAIAGVVATRNFYDTGYFAFNKHNVEKIRPDFKRAGIAAMAATINSLGNSACRRRLPNLNIVEGKMRELMRAYAKPFDKTAKEIVFEDRFGILKLVDFARCTLTLPEAEGLEAMADAYNLEFRPEWVEHVAALLDLDVQHAMVTGAIDFTDQLYLPWRLELMPDMFKSVLVDEVQDLNAAQTNLILKSVAKGGRIICVGDSRQAIYGWSGADQRSWKTMEALIQPEVMPMNTSYRCPKSHIALAQLTVPDIKAPAWQREGVLEYVEEDFVSPDNVRAGDMIISRRVAPLIRRALGMIKAGVPANVRGRDIGKSLSRLVGEVARRADWQHFGDGLQRYKEFEVAKLKARSASEERFALIDDQVESVLTAREGSSAESYEELQAHIEKIFDDKNKVIEFSSIHRAKGAQAKRVIVLEHPNVGKASRRMTQDQAEQELNCKYVSETRSLDELFLCRLPKRERQGDWSE